MALDLYARLVATLARLIRRVEHLLGRPACRVCGCTEYAACPVGCFWVEPDLCSACEWDLEHEHRRPIPYPLSPVEPA